MAMLGPSAWSLRKLSARSLQSQLRENGGWPKVNLTSYGITTANHWQTKFARNPLIFSSILFKYLSADCKYSKVNEIQKMVKRTIDQRRSPEQARPIDHRNC